MSLRARLLLLLGAVWLVFGGAVTLWAFQHASAELDAALDSRLAASVTSPTCLLRSPVVNCRMAKLRLGSHNIHIFQICKKSPRSDGVPHESDTSAARTRPLRVGFIDDAIEARWRGR